MPRRAGQPLTPHFFPTPILRRHESGEEGRERGGEVGVTGGRLREGRRGGKTGGGDCGGNRTS